MNSGMLNESVDVMKEYKSCLLHSPTRLIFPLYIEEHNINHTPFLPKLTKNYKIEGRNP
jgi:hypothetical protein